MKRYIGVSITILIIAVILYRASQNSSPPTKVQDSIPDACVQRMFEAAKQGDVAAYLDCFTGSELQRIERELREQNRTEFARSLVEAVAQLKGHVVFGQAENGSSDRTSLVVERIYRGRNEKQNLEMTRESGVWRISGVRTLAVFQPDIPYGTPVDQPPKNQE